MNKEKLFDPIAFTLGATVGTGLSFISRASAKSAVEVRPELGNVDFLTALLTQHGGDWLFYNFPNVMTVVIAVFAGLISLVAWWSA